ncbi:sulfotransferase family protein [Caballeronia sp.]|uniref:sulfotransferase family protein n=1 Tax=Caballeronia sp. TaxID=1931223 RepID=UPI003C515B55
MVTVLGMHRSGTSLITRGLMSLGIYLGDDFVEVQPDNPTGYWEDRHLQDFNERVLTALGLKWESVAFLKDSRWEEPEIEAIRMEAIEYIRANFLAHPLWGFKDPRTLRLLPFWSPVFQRLGLEDAYVMVIRNPLSVAQSLIARQSDVFDAAMAHGLWLVHTVTYFSRIAQKPFIVIDYDLFMDDPRGQLERIGRALEIPQADARLGDIEDFVANFIDPELRHSQFGRLDRDFVPHLSILVQKAYLCLRRLATDRIGPDRSQYWSEWQQIEAATWRFFENE